MSQVSSRTQLPTGVLLLAFCLPLSVRGEAGLDEVAGIVLNSARRAYNDGEFGFAAARFGEFLARFEKHPDALQARFGLGLAIVDSGAADEKAYQTVVEQLTAVAAANEFSEKPLALYYLGLGHRGQARIALEKGKKAPDKAAEHSASATKSFQTAAAQFAAAATAFRAKAQAAGEGGELPDDWEWVARACCENAEALLRAGKPKEAMAAAEQVESDPILARSRYRLLSLYYHGFAAFRLEDYETAAKSLLQVKPDAASVTGAYAGHAQYLLARSHHLRDQRDEAMAAYNIVIEGNEKARSAAAEALKNEAALKDKPDERARLTEQLAIPEYAERARYYRAAFMFEGGAFDAALKAIESFMQFCPKSDLVPDAQLRKGICHWQLKNPGECINALRGLPAAAPRLADQALSWTGKSQVAMAPEKAEERATALRTAIATLGQAVQILQPLAATSLEAKTRLADVLLCIADANAEAGKYQDAAASYQALLATGVDPQRAEDVSYRLATALHLAGQYKDSDAACAKFTQSYPQSERMPTVRFRNAENAFFQAVEAGKALPADAPDREKQVRAAFAAAVERYQGVVDDYPDFAHLNLARLGLGGALYRQGKYHEANTAMAPIPPAEIKDQLAEVPFLRADCLMRLVPEKPKTEADVLRVKQYLKEAVQLLNIYLGQNPKSPKTPEIYFKLGLCHQQQAAVMEDEEERGRLLKLAGGAYDLLISQHAGHALMHQAVIEKAKCLVTADEFEAALTELKRFTAAPLNASPLAPLAALRSAIILRAQEKPADAVALLDATRKQHEAALVASGEAKKEWAVLLHFHHGMALMEAEKLPEAKALLEDFMKKFPDRPEVPEASLRVGQAMVAGAADRFDAAQSALSSADATPEEKTKARAEQKATLKALAKAAEHFQGALALKPKQPESPAWARIHYELAWAYRPEASVQIETRRTQLQDVAAKAAAEKQGAPQDAAEVTLSEVPVQPAETKMIEQYKLIVAEKRDSEIAADARFELADFYYLRGHFDPAISLLNEALSAPSSKHLTEKLHYLLGVSLAGKGTDEEAVKHLEVVLGDLTSPLAPHAAFRAGEALLRMEATDRASAKFRMFVDQAAFREVPGLSDRALVRLAFAELALSKPAEAQKTSQDLIGRFPNSPLISQARFALGKALQAQNQLDAAIKVYGEILSETTSEYAARAQFQIAECRIGKGLNHLGIDDYLRVTYTYDYPEWNALSLIRAAAIAMGLEKYQDARKYLERVVSEYATTKHAEVAKQRLGELADKEKK